MAKQIDPWPEITEEEIEEEAQKNGDLCIRLGFIFQNAQQEAYEQWCAWDEAMGGEEAEIGEPLPQETTAQEFRPSPAAPASGRFWGRFTERLTEHLPISLVSRLLSKLEIPRLRSFIPAAGVAVLLVIAIAYVFVNRTTPEQQLLQSLRTAHGTVDAVAVGLRHIWDDVLGAPRHVPAKAITIAFYFSLDQRCAGISLRSRCTAGGNPQGTAG